MSALRILHLEDDAIDGELIQTTLHNECLDCTIKRVSSETDYREAIETLAYDLILANFSLTGFGGIPALELAKRVSPSVPFIFLSATVGVEQAVNSLKSGAADYVVKGHPGRLGAAILRAHAEAGEEREQARNEAKLRQQAELLNEAQDAIVVRNLEQQITYWNKGAERLYGWSAVEALGAVTSELLFRTGEKDADAIWNTILEKGVWAGDVTQVTKSGREIDVSSRRTLLRGATGVPLAVLNINTDITEKKDLQLQLFRNQRVDSLGAMAGGIAHDLNNILAPIVMVIDLLLDQLPEKSDRRMLDIAQSSAKRGADLVKQILQFASGAKARPVRVDMRAMIADLIRFCSKVFPPAIRVQSDVAHDLASILGDPTQMHQVLLNLCINARDAMPQGGIVFIEARNITLCDRVVAGQKVPISGCYIELCVSDTGTGIPVEIMNRVFDPFFTTKAEKGTGLGLSTVATILRNHQSFIEVISEVDRGTKFSVLFPALVVERDADLSELALPAPGGRGELILLVDDEFALLEMTRALLEAHNYSVIAASNGTEALKFFEERADEIALVITDLLMPGLGGRELVAAIHQSSPETLTICLTGSSEERAEPFLQADSCEFLHKPCSTQALLGTLGKMFALRRGTTRPNPAVN